MEDNISIKYKLVFALWVKCRWEILPLKNMPDKMKETLFIIKRNVLGEFLWGKTSGKIDIKQIFFHTKASRDFG